MTPVLDKECIRHINMDARGRMSPDEVRGKSSEICARFLGLPEMCTAKVVMSYMDFRNEVMTGELMKECIRSGKRIVLPVVVKNSGGRGELIAYEIRDLETDLRRGAYGILEPDPVRTKLADVSEIDVVAVPGLAFDASRYRVGYGAGYYDGFLKKTKASCLKAGLAFELQLVDRIPADPHDCAMDIVITEDRIIR